MNEKILVVIPHYGDDENLSNLLPTLGLDMPRVDLLGGQTLLAPFAFGEVMIINNNLVNRGFTKACNEGIRYALQYKYRAVWLLNNDCEIPDLTSAIRAFLGEFDAYPGTGVIGAKILSRSDPDFIHHAGTTAVFPAGIHKHGRVSEGAYNERSYERWVTGASMVISSDCLRMVGELDEGFMNYASDSDYCYRARGAGFDVVYLPVPIVHAIGQSAAPSREQLSVLASDMTYFKNKWVGGELFRRLDSDALL